MAQRGESILEAHPQRAEIERAIIAGQSVRSIAAWCQPRVSHATVSLFRSKLLKHVVRHSAKDVAREALSIAVKHNPEISAQDMQALTERRTLAEPFISRIEEVESARRRMLSTAEDKADARGFAAIDSARLRAIQLQAQLAGALTTDAASAAQQIAIAVFVQPAPAEPAGSQAASASAAVIDVEPVPQRVR